MGGSSEALADAAAYSHARPSPSPSRPSGSPGGVGIGPSAGSQSMPPPPDGPPPPPPGLGEEAPGEAEDSGLAEALALESEPPSKAEVSQARPSLSASKPFGSLGSAS